MNPEDAKGELLRVRREMASVEDQIGRVSREIDKAAELGDRDRLDDNRHIRNCLWKEKEQLRIQETVFLRILFTDTLQGTGSPTHPPQQPLHHHLPPQHQHQHQHQLQHQPHPQQQVAMSFPSQGNDRASTHGVAFPSQGDFMTGVHHGTPPGCHPMGGPHSCPLPPEMMGPCPPMPGHPGAPTPLAPAPNGIPPGAPPGSSLVPASPALKPSQPPGHMKGRRKASSPGPGTPGSTGGAPPGSAIVLGAPGSMGYESELSNPEGYEVNRSSDSKVMDVWREWKEGINDGPAVEKLEEARKRDRKLVWWKHKNDYKYWSKQMRIIHAVEKKASEFGGNMDAAIQFWEEILRVEFEGSISKLREALGGDKLSGADARAMANAPGGVPGGAVGVNGQPDQVVEMSNFKRQRKELLQRGLERMKQWPQQAAVVPQQQIPGPCP